MALIHKWKHIYIYKEKVKNMRPSVTGHGIRFIFCVRTCVCVSDRGRGVDVGIWIIDIYIYIYKCTTRTQQQLKKEKGTCALFGTAVSTFSERWVHSVHTQ
jgi:hypothetical protein